MDMLERLHLQVWSRFLHKPYGYLLDYADEKGNATIPTAQECAQAMPNAASYWTPIANGAFFTGLYVYALIAKYNLAPEAETEKEIDILMGGLKLLQDVAKIDGFIARGVADDGVSHYPFSSEDQVVPWVLAMDAYRRSKACKDPHEIRQRMLKTLLAMKHYGWGIPTEIEGMVMGSWISSTSWRGVGKLLYCLRVLAELTENPEDMAQYEMLRDSAPEGWIFSRKEMLSHGFSHCMVYQPNLEQSWIYLAAHLGLGELCRMDPENARYFAQGALLNGVTALRKIDVMKSYDNVPGGFDMDWRKMAPYWKPVGEHIGEAIRYANQMGAVWRRDVVPHRNMEHNILGFSLFYAWIAVTCGDAAVAALAKQKLMENAETINWEQLHLSFAFAAEAALIS